jgi:hypothetical protein
MDTQVNIKNLECHRFIIQANLEWKFIFEELLIFFYQAEVYGENR